eukprot:1410035-Pyramimonas_sp.AAC.1
MAGRLGAVRFKTEMSDVTAIVGYAPVEPPGGRGRAAAHKVCEKFWQHMSELLSALPARTVHIILLDVNARAGSVSSSSIGLCNADIENTNGH